jgi:hypothetical protein
LRYLALKILVSVSTESASQLSACCNIVACENAAICAYKPSSGSLCALKAIHTVVSTYSAAINTAKVIISAGIGFAGLTYKVVQLRRKADEVTICINGARRTTKLTVVRVAGLRALG